MLSKHILWKNREEAYRIIRALKNLEHPNIPALTDVSFTSEGIRLSCSYIVGTTMGEVIRNGARVTLRQICVWTEGLCGILEYMHNHRPYRVYHLDLHPDNLILHHDCVHIIDFGNSWCGSGICFRNEYGGTAMFSAPEMFSGGPVDERADIYSVGRIILYLLTAEDDTSGKAMRNLIYEVGLACTREDPQLRIRSASELRSILCEIIRLL